MRKKLISTLFILTFSPAVMAQTLIPATSEDLSEFDRQVSEAQQVQDKRKSQIGAAVAAEAKQLQNSSALQKKKNGKNSLDPRDKADQDRLGASSGGDNSSQKDAKVSSPSNSDHGNSANAPGHNKIK